MQREGLADLRQGFRDGFVPLQDCGGVVHGSKFLQPFTVIIQQFFYIESCRDSPSDRGYFRSPEAINKGGWLRQNYHYPFSKKNEFQL